MHARSNFPIHKKWGSPCLFVPYRSRKFALLSSMGCSGQPYSDRGVQEAAFPVLPPPGSPPASMMLHPAAICANLSSWPLAVLPPCLARMLRHTRGHGRCCTPLDTTQPPHAQCAREAVWGAHYAQIAGARSRSDASQSGRCVDTPSSKGVCLQGSSAQGHRAAVGQHHAAQQGKDIACEV
jgi:hypothetical protein